MSGADIEILVDAGKRFLVLHRPLQESAITEGDKSEPIRDFTRVPVILEGLRRQAVLNGRMFTGDRAALLTGPIDDLNQALEKAKLNQAERGVVLGLSQSAVSRRGKRGEMSEELKEVNPHA